MRIECENEPLNVVLHQLHEQYGIQFSYAPEVVSTCSVSVDAQYASVDKAIDALTNPCAISVEKLNGVYILYRAKEAEDHSKSTARVWIRATITDAESGETLPFTSIQLNRIGLVSDVNGRLSYRSQDSLVRVQVSHLGYQNLDTFINGSGVLTIKLKPLTRKLKAVEIRTGSLHSKKEGRLTRNPGIIKLNHQVAVFQPGSSDNTLFNVLRLQPGILAAGEQTKDFIIQGSYRGQSQILFDGITLFDVSSYNDHIGAVNPLMVKDIEVHKSGFSAGLGDRLGGVVNITGTEGRKDKLHANLRLNNQTVAGLVSAPVHKGAALQLAFRQTYYQLYEPLGLDFLYSDILYHSFTDLNVKYSGRFKGGNSLDISLIGFRDKNKLAYEEKNLNKNYKAYSFQQNEQQGGSLRYGKMWPKAGITNMTLAWSSLETQIDNSWIFEDKRAKDVFVRNASTLNTVSERSLKIDHILPSGERQNVKFGLAWIQNNTRDTQSYSPVRERQASLNRWSVYVVDDVSLGKRWSVHPSLRVDYIPNFEKAFVQPRILANWDFIDNIKLNAAWGIYRQFLSNDVFTDGSGNFNFNWVLHNGSERAVPQSIHKTLNVQYHKGATTLQVEGFLKNTSDLVRWKTDKRTGRLFPYTGIGRAYGVESTIKRKTEKLETWLTYTLSKTEEQFREGAPAGTYARAPQDQRHEVKASAVLQWHSFFYSFNYVYGSGFGISNERWSDRNYSRLDAALLYRRENKKMRMETGLSVLNVLNRRNVRPGYLTVFFDQSSSIQLGTLFTPSIFLNIGF